MTTYHSGGLGSPTSIELLRRSLAEAWILDDDPDTLARGMADSLGVAHTPRTSPLIRILAPVCALQVFGPGERMEERAHQLTETFGLFRQSFDAVGSVFRDELRHVAQAGNRLGRVADRLREAERVLLTEGWEYDPPVETNGTGGKVKRAQAGGRAYSWRRRLAVAVATDLDPDGELRNTARTRRQVSAVLRFFLPPEEVGPEKDGPLDIDLGNEIKKRAVASS